MPYPHGQCTWYVYNRMKQFGTSISGDLGDAYGIIELNTVIIK